MHNIVIGIGGASRSGKTTLATDLQEHYGQKMSVTVLHQDNFIQPEEKIPGIRHEIDWEHPDSLDFDALIAAILDARREFALTIVEGFLAYHDSSLYSLFDVKLFVRIDETTFFARRRQDRRYGTDAEWYIAHTWKSYLRYGQVPEEIMEHVIMLDQEYKLDDVIKLVDQSFGD